MRKTSPLDLNDIIRPSDQACALVWEKVKRNQKENLARGLLCEYAHDEAFVLHQWIYTKPPTTDVYDREWGGVWQDDKLATWRDGVLSSTHTVSEQEDFLWLKQPDVIIHSFEEIDDLSYRYRGALSYQKLKYANLVRKSKYDDTLFFNRYEAYKVARV